MPSEPIPQIIFLLILVVPAVPKNYYSSSLFYIFACIFISVFRSFHLLLLFLIVDFFYMSAYFSDLSPHCFANYFIIFKCLHVQLNYSRLLSKDLFLFVISVFNLKSMLSKGYLKENLLYMIQYLFYRKIDCQNLVWVHTDIAVLSVNEKLLFKFTSWFVCLGRFM